MKFCDYCEEWVEPDNGRCPICGKLIEEKKKIPKDYEEDLDPDELDWIN